MFVMPASCDSSYFPPPQIPVPLETHASWCAALDPATGAECNRQVGHNDPTLHWFEDCDWRIQWQDPPPLLHVLE